MPGSSVGHIPIDLLKTLVLIADLGSVTRAARALGISQSAVSAQIRRLEGFVSGAVFVKHGRGIQLSELGRQVLSHARRILALSDQLQTMVGAGPGNSQIRIGLPAGIDQELVARILPALTAELGDTLVHCDTRASLMSAIEAGFVDVVYLVDIGPIPVKVAVEWTEQWHWIKSPGFVLSPGAPVPLAACPGSLSDRLGTSALRRAGMEYSVAFSSADRSLRKAAVAAGIGLMVASERTIEAANLCVAREYYLPALPLLHAGLYVADGFDGERADGVLRVLWSILRPPSSPDAAFEKRR